MKLYTTLLLLALPVMGLHAQETYLSSDFESANSTAGYDFQNVDGMNPNVSVVKGITPKKEWFRGQGVSNNASMVMLSMSCRVNSAVPTDNWLITSAIKVKSADAWVQWDASSIHHELPESYEVLVGTDPDDIFAYEPIYSTEAESYYWTHHMASLAKYAGQTVYIAFRHTSLNKYILGLDNIKVGTLAPVDFAFTDQTEHTTSFTAHTGVHGQLQNFGADASAYTLRCISTLADGTTSTASQPISLKSNETADYHFDVANQLNRVTKYSLDVLDAQGEVVQSLLSDSLYTSNYPRTLFMEKATSYWCTSCPKANPFSFSMEKRMGSQFVQADVQYPSNNGVDAGKMVCEEYLNRFRVMNLPTTKYNRYTQWQDGANYGEMMKSYFRPTYAYAELGSAELVNKTVQVKARGEFAYDLTNTDDNYRMGFLMVEDAVSIPLPQENICSTPSDNEWYYLPSKFSSPYNVFKHVIREGATAFTGVEKSFPAQIEKGKSYEVSYSFDLPEKVRSVYADEAQQTSNLSLIALILNTKTGEVLNASRIPVDVKGYLNGVHDATTSAQPELVRQGNAFVALFGAGETGTVSIYGIDGRLLSQTQSLQFNLDQYPNGTYVVRLQSASGKVATVKVIK